MQPHDCHRPEVLARSDGVLGEVVLRRRGHGPGAVHELVVNGVFLMDTTDVSSERRLATDTLDVVEGDGLRVMVGGLGLGFTAAHLLRSSRVAEVTVVEIEPLLTGWLRGGLVPSPPGLWDDARLTVVDGDVAAVLATLDAGRLDAVLLDVDNGPDFLVHGANARVYGAPVLSAAASAVRAGGVVSVWSASPSRALHDGLEDAVGPCQERLLRVVRDGRELQYALYLAVVRPGRRGRRASASPPPCSR